MIKPDFAKGHSETALFKNQITVRLSQAQGRLNAQATKLLRNAGDISLVEWRILALLMTLDSPTPAKIRVLASIDRGQLSRTMAKMQADGLLVKNDSPSDKRTMVLALTDAGRDLFERVDKVMKLRREALGRSFSEAELNVLEDIIDRLNNFATRELGEF